MSRACNVCSKDKSHFIMHNKTVCLSCDELLFDMEIESDEEATTTERTGVRLESTFNKTKTEPLRRRG